MTYPESHSCSGSSRSRHPNSNTSALNLPLCIAWHPPLSLAPNNLNPSRGTSNSISSDRSPPSTPWKFFHHSEFLLSELRGAYCPQHSFFSSFQAPDCQCPAPAPGLKAVRPELCLPLDCSPSEAGVTGTSLYLWGRRPPRRPTTDISGFTGELGGRWQCEGMAAFLPLPTNQGLWVSACSCDPLFYGFTPSCSEVFLLSLGRQLWPDNLSPCPVFCRGRRAAWQVPDNKSIKPPSLLPAWAPGHSRVFIFPTQQPGGWGGSPFTCSK